jgi:MFS family permease
MNLPEEFRHDWGTVLAATVGIMASCITLVNYSLGVFVVPLSREFGWSRQEILTATSVVTGGALVTSFAVGWLADRYSLGWLIAASQAGFGLLFFALAAFTDGLAVFYGLYLAMAIVAGCTLPITFTKIVAARFVRRRGLALGLALAGTGLSGFLVPPFVGAVVNAYGWRAGYVAVGAIPLGLAMPLSLLFLRRPLAPGSAAPASGAGLAFGDALRRWRFWTIAAAFFVASAAATVVSANAVPLLIARGFASQTAANIAAAFGLAVIAGRVLLGALADRVWAPPLALAFLGPGAAATLAVALAPLDVPRAVAMMTVIGLATGAEGDLLSYLVARYFGLRAYGRIFSGIFVAFIGAIAVAAPLSGYAYDRAQSYTPAMLAAAAGWLLCPLMLLTLGPYPRWADEANGA